MENTASIQVPYALAQRTEAILCFHCGEDCPDDLISLENKLFCCEGCKLVYEILNAHDLTQYYRIDKAPGINRRNVTKLQYAWLDDPEVVSRLADFNDSSLIRITLHLPQIHCSSCIWLLENLYKLLPGILQSKVNFLKKEALISLDPKLVSVRKVAEMLAAIGYAPELNLNSIDAERKTGKTDRSIYYQLGVAGFAFGNIMLLTFPEYLGLEEGRFRQGFGYANIILGLPVILYSARPYLSSAWNGLRHGFLNIDVPLSLGAIALFGRSVYEILMQTGSGYMDSLAGLIFFLLIGRWFQQKTYHRLSFDRDYKSYFPVSATIVQNDKEDSVALDKLSVGDTLVVKHKELIPADGVLLRGSAVIDYSFVTGESEPVEKQKGDRIYAGGRQVGDAIELTVIKRVSNSYLTQLWNDAAFTKEAPHKTTTSQIADRLGKRFTYVILGIALTTLLYWLPRDVSTAINAFTAVLIIACPCAVALSIPFTLGNVIRIMGKKGFFLKNTNVIENLAKVNKIVFDKTGTITRAGRNALEYGGTDLSQDEMQHIRLLASQSSHPMSREIVKYMDEKCFRTEKAGLSTDVMKDFHEEPGTGLSGVINGHRVEISKGNTGGSDVSINRIHRGNFRLRHEYRSGLFTIISRLKSKYQLYLLSGDNDQQRKELGTLLSAGNLNFNQSPKDKLNFITSLMDAEKDAQVMMVGDGLNDAGALQKSHVGIVIAENTNNFTPACDAILDASQFEKLPDYMNLSRMSLRIVYWAYGLAFLYNIIGLSYAVQGNLSPVIAAILMPLSSVTIVLFGVGMSSWMAKKVNLPGAGGRKLEA